MNAAHANCPPTAHNTDADGIDVECQRLTPDGQLACNDCSRPIFYCTRTEWYHHIDSAEVGCFLIAPEDESDLIPVPVMAGTGWTVSYPAGLDMRTDSADSEASAMRTARRISRRAGHATVENRSGNVATYVDGEIRQQPEGASS